MSAMPDHDPYSFIDLARLGRTDWWSGVKAFLRILGWLFLILTPYIVVLGVIAYSRDLAPSEPLIEVSFLVVYTIALWIGLRGAVVKSHGRPFLSLMSTDLQFSARRVAVGAALWFGAQFAVIAALSLIQAIADPVSLQSLAASFSWPTDRMMLVTGLLSFAIFPFQAAAEELLFRGWLTQTLGQAIRRRWLVVLAVAVLFALAHGDVRGIFAIISYMVLSIGLSALSLGDRRLELAIGAHAANNIFVVALALLTSGPGGQPTLFLQATVIPWSVPLITAAQLGLVYLAARRFMRRPIASPDAIVTDEYSAPIA